MKTILLLHDESRSPNARLHNVSGTKVTQRHSAGTPGCNCDLWGHPLPDCVAHNVQGQLKLAFSTSVPHATEWQRIENQIWIAGAHRGDGKRFIVRADEKLTAFLELESAIRGCGELP